MFGDKRAVPKCCVSGREVWLEWKEEKVEKVGERRLEEATPNPAAMTGEEGKARS